MLIATRASLFRPSFVLPCRILCKRHFHSSHVREDNKSNKVRSTTVLPNNQNTNTGSNNENTSSSNNSNTNNTSGYQTNPNKKYTTIIGKIAEMEVNSTPDGGFEIQVPRIFPPKPKHTQGYRQKKRMRVRAVQRRNDHKKYIHTRPTRDTNRVNPRHLSLPLIEIKPKFPAVVVPKLRQVEHEKLVLPNSKT